MTGNDQWQAGWYADPQMPGTQRYWDGAQWTDRVAPIPPQAERVGVLTIARGVALGVAAVVAGVAVWVGVSGANDDSDCAIENAQRTMDGLSTQDC
jgi:hypothetical protein